MKKQLTLSMAMLLAISGTVSAQYQDWRHSGSLYILTSPEGADLSATALEENFPMLVRLNKDWFDFSQAKANGEDIRFAAAAGKALTYQIEEWDAASGTASIWVRIPAIEGNARQEIKMRWGNADAPSESNGAAVFNASNGYLSVWHMDEPVVDAVGMLKAKDTGTTSAAGVIGKGRRFSVGKGLDCGKEITNFPQGASPSSSEAWVKADKANARIIGWGNEEWQGKIILNFASPPHIRMDCYFSNGNVAGDSRLPISQWVHLVHTYTNGDSRVYVNGVLDGVNTSLGSPLAIKTPARLSIGGWYDNYELVGDLDEVRVSNVARSAAWIKLQYENQKPLQSLVGHLLQPGTTFSTSEKSLKISEGGQATVTSTAAGAQKVYWILKSDGRERVIDVDRFSTTLDAGRVTGDKSQVLQFKAIYADAVKTIDIPVTVTEAIPEPVFTLKGPAAWDGRETIEVAPRIGNLAAMRAKGAGDLTYNWTVSGMAVIKETAPDRLLLQRAQNSGKLTVSLALSNGGAEVTVATSIAVREPRNDAWIHRTPAPDEKPEENQFYARDDKNEGTLFCNGKLAQPADALFLNLYADDKLVETLEQKATKDKTYAFTVRLKPGLIKYKVELISKTDGAETVLHQAGNIVCGDAYIIDGQSNALATDTGEESPRETHEWIRSYARPRYYREGEAQNLWCYPVWKAKPEHMAELGWWGMELAKRLVKSQQVPIFIINGAVGGSRIDQHQRSTTDPTDLETIYGRLLWRVRGAKLTHGIRAVLWHQGENDQGADGPTGGYGWESYQQYFIEMSAAWKQDFPNVRHYYIYQIWPNSCSMGNGNGDMLREVQRTLPRLYSNMDIMSTLGIEPPGPAHFPLEGWAEFARLIQPLIERDFYGKVVAAPITPPNLIRACCTGSEKNSIALEFDQPVVWDDSLIDEFYLDESKEKIASGAVSGNVVTLKLKEASAARKITYIKEMSWSQKRLLKGKNGIAALTFRDAPIADSP